MVSPASKLPTPSGSPAPLPVRRHPRVAPLRRPATNAPETREAAQPLSADPWLEPAAWNCDRVRARVIALVGCGGHHALMQRSLVRVRDEFPWLGDVRVEDGYLTGLAAVLPVQSFAARKAACAAIRKQYVSLLLAFLGEGLTQKLVGDDWPELLPSQGEGPPPSWPRARLRWRQAPSSLRTASPGSSRTGRYPRG